MVTLRGKGRGDAEQSSGPAQRLRPPAQSSEEPPKSPPETRSRKSRRPNGFTSEDEEQSHIDSETQDEEEEESQRGTVRKSKRSFGITDGRRSRLRRSTRVTKPTSRYQASNMFDGISNNPTRCVMSCMGNMRKRRRLSNKDGKIYSKAQKRRTPEPPERGLSDSEEEEEDQGPVPEEKEENRQEVEAGDDSSCSSVDRNFDAKLSRASSLYQGPSSEFPRGSFRISASGPNTTRRGAFRATKSAWSNPSDEDDDSDDEAQNTEKVQESWRPLGPPSDGRRRNHMRSGAGLADIDPMAIDQSVGFESIGGLSGHISALKEMVVFPLLYPEVFDSFKIQPPRGCLFYGPPGTGKTLVARALANECRHGNRKVSFFMRKGADCLSKWVGESERQLRLLFEQAYQMRPSIIFFDEIDGLAPVRSSRQDQIHSSIVSTLLALMDGLDSRGEVVVIGATNRLDSIDPALRRPGRFDREFLFGLPDRESRKQILKIHTLPWRPPPSDDFLEELAERCVGYCGADIRAVCTEAALCALRRRYPQIYTTSQKLLLDVSSIFVSSCDFVAAMRKMTPASHRLATTPAKRLSSVVQPLLGGALRDILEALQRLFPHAEQGVRSRGEPALTSGVLDEGLMCGRDEDSCSTSISAPSRSRDSKFMHFARSAVRHPTSHRPRLLLAGRPGSGLTSHLAPAVLHALERFSVHSLDSAVLFGVSSTSPEEACAQVFIEAKRTSPSVLYLPHIQQWWDTAGPALRASFLSLLDGIPSFSPVLLLATCSVRHHQLDPEIQSLFQDQHGEVYTVSVPSRQERTDFFQDLILNQAAEAPPSKTTGTKVMEILPVAPMPPPRRLPDHERCRLEEQEEDVLRELRLFLRNVTERLSLDRRFKAFSRPVDIEEVPDYLQVIRKPMDLSTLLTNIDEHRYSTVGEFVADADLIWQNALEYNPDSDPIDRHIRHRACALKDTLRTIIRDQLHEDFERQCEEIRESRIRRAFVGGADSDAGGSSLSPHGARARKKKPYKRPRRSKWSRGIIQKPKKKLPVPVTSSSSSLSSPLSSSLSSLSSWSSSSDGSESSSDEQSCPPASNGHQNTPNRVLLNGLHRPRPSSILRVQTQTSKTPLTQKRAVNRVCLRITEEESQGADSRASRAALEQMQALNRGRLEEALAVETPPLVVDHGKLKDLLSRVVSRTDGLEAEPLEKLYAVLAQSIYRHRHSYNKSQLLQEMRKEIDGVS